MGTILVGPAYDPRLEEDIRRDTDLVKEFRNALPLKKILSKECPAAIMVFEFLKVNMNYHNCIVCSSTVIEEYLEISKSTVSRAIAALVKHKFVYVKKTGASNVYFLNAKIVWSAWANQKEYAEFSAHVIITKSEQAQIKKVRTTTRKSTKLYENTQVVESKSDIG